MAICRAGALRYADTMSMPNASFSASDALLRPARDDDGVAIAALIAACFAEYPGCFFDWSEFPELRAPATWAAERGTRLIVAECAHEIIGVVGATPHPQQRAVEWHKFYVAQPWRGSGLALRLGEQVIDEARIRRAGQIFLWTDTRFARAHRFYENIGFRRQAEQRSLNDVSSTQEYLYLLDLDARGHVAPVA